MSRGTKMKDKLFISYNINLFRDDIQSHNSSLKLLPFNNINKFVGGD